MVVMPGVVLFRAKPHELPVRGVGLDIVLVEAGIVSVLVGCTRLLLLVAVDRYSLQLLDDVDGAVMVVVTVSLPDLMTLVYGTVSRFSGIVLDDAMDTEYLDGSMVPRLVVLFELFDVSAWVGVIRLDTNSPPPSVTRRDKMESKKKLGLVV